MDDEIVMYVIVNSDLKMDKGKVAAQVAHSACKAVVHACSNKCDEFFGKWYHGSYAKIVLRANTDEMKKLIENYPTICFWTIDEGRTQIPKGSLTTIAFLPLPRSKAPKELADMKLF